MNIFCVSTLRGILISVRELGTKDSGFFSSDQLQRTPVPPNFPQVFTLQIQRVRRGIMLNDEYEDDEENEKWVGP